MRIAVQQGWINGYTDGTFRPDNTVTLEEACTAALKLLGYKMKMCIRDRRYNDQNECSTDS